MNGVIRHLRRAALLQDGAGLTDGELLDQYLRRRDEDAFEALVRRHGPMVWGVCRRVLGNEADAEDAFQATFLVLVRKAASIVPRSLVGNWLYGVAHNTALKAKVMNSKRRVKERQARERPRPEPPGEDWQHLHAQLDEELSRLPEKYRAPIVLCDLEGKTLREAAKHLGWPQGTVAGRLSRARARLARQMSRHGLALAGGTLATALVQNAASACVPRLLVDSTVKAASSFAPGTAAPAGVVSAKVAALTQGVVKAMLLAKLKTVVGVVVIAVLLVGGTGALALPKMLGGLPEARGQEAFRLSARQAEKPQPAVTWKEKHFIKMERGNQVFSVSISPDGKIVAYGATRELKLLDMSTGKELVQVDRDLAFTTAISPDGKILASGHIKAIKLWDATTGNAMATLADDTKNISHVVFSPDGKLLASAELRALRLWDLTTNKEIRRLEAGKPEGRIIHGVAFSPDGKTLASAETQAKTVKLWEVATGKEINTLEGHTGAVLGVAFSPDGKTLASADGDGQVKLWDMSTGKEKTNLKWQTNGLQPLAFSPDGKLLATTGGDSHNVMLWDAKTGKDLVALDHTDRVWSVAFSGDGKTIVTAGDDGVRIWTAEKK
jgi:RNA polymerase sigma factor (sigma-70 family)